MSGKHYSLFLILIVSGFISGLVITLEFDIARSLLIAGFLFGFALVYLYFIKRDLALSLALGLFLIFFSIIGLRVNYLKTQHNPLVDFTNTKVTAIGFVSSEIRESTYYRNFTIDVSSINGRLINSSPKILVRTSFDIDLKLGDEVMAESILELPENFENESGITFDYINYLKAGGVTHILHKAKVEKTGNINDGILRRLSSVKESFISNIEKTFSFPKSALLSGLLLGSKQSLGENNLEQFRRAGVSHIIVLSGFNIAIVALAIMWFASFLPRAVALALSLSGVILFSIMVGAEATVVRATIMVILALLGKFIGRQYDALRALLIAGGIMLFFNPYLLLHDISFELSFMATLALILIVPIIEPYFLLIPSTLGLREIIISTIAVELLVTPLILYRLGSISVLALFSNILILPVISPTMLFGFLSALSGFISQTIATVIGYPAYLLLGYELSIVKWISDMPFALIEIKEFSGLILVMVYLIIFVWLMVLRSFNKYRDLKDKNNVMDELRN